MLIYIMRHGQAEMIFGDDKKRQLTDLGVQEVTQMAKWLKNQLQPLECVLVSPYVRAQQTWLTTKTYLPCKQVLQSAGLVPNGDAKAVCEYIYDLVSEQKMDNLLVISHLPLVSFVVEQLALGSGTPIFLTGAVACIDFNPKTLLGELMWMHTPQDVI